MANLTLRSIDALPITRWLERWGEGDSSAADQLAKAMLPLLRKAAVQRLRGNPLASDELSPTILVQEAWSRLTPASRQRFKSRHQFFGSAVAAMRLLLIDRYKSAQQKPASMTVDLTEPADPADDHRLGIRQAMHELHVLHPRQSDAIFMAKVMGCTLEEIGEELGVSFSTARNDVLFAEAWLKRALART